MGDSYPSIFSFVLWGAAALFLIVAIHALTPAAKSDPKRGDTFVAGLMFGVLLVGLGFWAQGSRSADALREANKKVAQSYADYQAAVVAEKAVAFSQASPRDAVSKGSSMDFTACLSRIRTMSSELGVAPSNIVETADMRVVRFHATDGSVLVTCSKPDRKMIITRSAAR